MRIYKQYDEKLLSKNLLSFREFNEKKQHPEKRIKEEFRVNQNYHTQGGRNVDET